MNRVKEWKTATDREVIDVPLPRAVDVPSLVRHFRPVVLGRRVAQLESGTAWVRCEARVLMLAERALVEAWAGAGWPSNLPAERRLTTVDDLAVASASGQRGAAGAF